MAISRVGQAAAAATSVTLPTHQAGDLIIISARGTTAAPTTPTAGGTVPTFASLQSGIANAVGLTTAAATATGSTHTSGTWTNATDLVVAVFRTSLTSGTIETGASSSANNNNNRNIPYPALTLQQPDGTSAVYRAGARSVAAATLIDTVGTPPAFTLVTSSPSPPSIAAWNRFELAGNQGADTMNLGAGNAAHRAHSIEIKESAPPPLVRVLSWRFRNDDGSETAATWKAAEKTDVTVLESETSRLRFVLQETANVADSNTFGYQLQHQKNGGTFAEVDRSAGTPVNIRLGSSTHVTYRQATTKQMGGTGTFTAGEVEEDGGGSISGVGTGPTANGNTESEWVLTPVANDVQDGDQLLIRVHDSSTGLVVPLADGVSWPIVTVGASTTTKYVGVIDEVAVYDTALTQASATAHYNAGITSGLFPSTYFTGPLGERNIIPAAQHGAMLALWCGFSGATLTQKQDRIAYLENAAGRQADILAVHIGGGGTFGGQTQCAFYSTVEPEIDWVISRGSAVYLTWTPNRSTINNDSIIKQIINGQRDACIDAMAVALRDKGVRIMLRPFHEFDSGNYHIRGDSGYDYNYPTLDKIEAGAALVQAWQYFVDRFQFNGATNVGFFWCPIQGGSSREIADTGYPGDAYVDWTGCDRYNRASGFSICSFSGWTEFKYLFKHASCGGIQENYHDRFGVTKGKPYFIGETGTRYDSATPNRKNQWFADIPLAKTPTDPYFMSNLIGVCYFDNYVLDEGQPGNLDNDWRIDANQTADMYAADQLGTQDPTYGLNGWVQWAQDANWNVGVAP